MTDQEVLPPLPKGYEAWHEALMSAAHNYKYSIWDVGDLLNEGEKKFGELFSQAAEETKLAPATLQNAMWVCKSIPQNIRKEDLSFSLHMEVAKLEHRHQKTVLGLAVEHEWPSKEVRKRVKAVINGDDEALLPDWNPSSPGGTSSLESAGEADLASSPQDSPADTPAPEEEKEPERQTRPDLGSRAAYIAFHTSEIFQLCQDTAPSMVVDDLDSGMLNKFFMEAEVVVDFLAGCGNHKP